MVLPAARDSFVVSVSLGRWQANCYLVGDRTRGAAVLVDPGERAEGVVALLATTLGVEIEALLLTHGHIDHLWSAPALAESLDVPVMLHDDDRWLWDDPAAGLGVPRDVLEDELGLDWSPSTEHLRSVEHGQRVTAAGLEFEVRHTPGHTPGHVVYLTRDLARAQVSLLVDVAQLDSEDPGDLAWPSGTDAAHPTPEILLSGDLLFAGSIGRTDFPRGSTDDMMRSLATTVLTLEDDTLVLPGHDRHTTIGRERVANPFLTRLIAQGR